MFVTPKFCISIAFSFSWGHFNSKEKLKTMLMQTKSIMVCYGIFCRGISGQLARNLVPRAFWLAFLSESGNFVYTASFYQYMTGQETILARRFSSSVEESIESTPKIFTHFLLKVKIKIF